ERSRARGRDGFDILLCRRQHGRRAAVSLLARRRLDGLRPAGCDGAVDRRRDRVHAVVARAWRRGGDRNRRLTTERTERTDNTDQTPTGEDVGRQGGPLRGPVAELPCVPSVPCVPW